MKLDHFKYSFNNLMHRKLRSWLTIISILIGIMSIYALVSFGQGLSSYIDTISSELGTDKLIIQPRGVGAPGTDDNFFLSKEDVEFAGKIKGVDQISGSYIFTPEIEFRDQKKYIFLMGMPFDSKTYELMADVLTVDIFRGRLLNKGEKSSVILGYNYQFDEEIFEKGVKLGDKILIDGVKFNVVGFYDEVGNPQDDSNVYMSLSGFETLYPSKKDKYAWVLARASPNEDPTALAEKVEDKLRKFKGQEEGKEDFYVQTFEQAIEIFTNILGVINGVLALIALISLLVAGVNIMNTMYTAVLERTQEIGVMKAIGARNTDIGIIFVFESGFLGMVGGAMGIVVGWGVSSLGGVVAANAGYPILKPIFPLWLTIGCLVFAFLVGALAGLLPARQAAKLRPVDALRYE